MKGRIVRIVFVTLFAGLLFAFHDLDAPANHEGNAILSATNFFGTGVLDVDFIITVDPPSDAGCLAHSWTLDFGDGSFPQSGGTTGTFAVPHQYTNFSPSTQIFFAELQFTRQGQHEPRGPRCETSVSQTQLVITVEPALPLIAIVLTPEPIVGPPPVEVQFDGSETMTDSHCPITNYDWGFADGTSASGEKTIHTYNELGAFTVNLQTTDSCGRRDERMALVLVKRFEPEGFDQVVMELQAAGRSLQDFKGQLEGLKKNGEDNLEKSLMGVDQGASAAASTKAASQSLSTLCSPGALFSTDEMVLDHLIELLEDILSKMGVDPSPFSEAKPKFEAALAKLQEAKAMLSSDSAKAYMAACGSQAASMALQDGMTLLMDALRQQLMLLADNCSQMEAEVGNAIGAVAGIIAALGEVQGRPELGGTALQGSIDEVIQLLSALGLDQIQKTLQSLCSDLQMYAQEPSRLIQGNVQQNVENLKRKVATVLDRLREDLELLQGGFNPEGPILPYFLMTYDQAKFLFDLEGWTCDGEYVTFGYLGTDGDDTIHGTENAEVIQGRGGIDNLYGEGGHDIICGGSGNDFIEGWEGNDRILGGLDMDSLYGGPDVDQLLGGGNVVDNAEDWLFGGGHDDYMYGQGGDDHLFGQDGRDWLYGGDGDDELYGDYPLGFYSPFLSDDHVYGEGDNDTLSGGRLSEDDYDWCDGGPAADAFADTGIPSAGCENSVSIP